MSGGRFNYNQDIVKTLAEEIEEALIDADYPEDIKEKFRETADELRIAAKKVQRIDWLLSGDDSEEWFRRRWEEEIGQ